MSRMRIRAGRFTKPQRDKFDYFIEFGHSSFAMTKETFASIGLMISDEIGDEQPEKEREDSLVFNLACDPGSGFIEMSVKPGGLLMEWREVLRITAKLAACISKSSGLPISRVCKELESASALIQAHDSPEDAFASENDEPGREFTL